jgi:hypothetical protein
MLSAVAAYERTLTSFDSPFDHFIAAEANAISDSAKRGWELFNTKARCNLCHALTDNQRDATLFIDNDFYNIGVGILRHHVTPLAQQAEREVAQGNLPAIDTAAITSDLSVLGRFLVTRKEKDIASFKTPGPRNIGVAGRNPEPDRPAGWLLSREHGGVVRANRWAGQQCRHAAPPRSAVRRRERTGRDVDGEREGVEVRKLIIAGELLKDMRRHD